MKLADVPWEVRRHLLCKAMQGWTPQMVDEMPWVDVVWTEALLSVEAKADRALAEREGVK